jgi:hypothetical protein
VPVSFIRPLTTDVRIWAEGGGHPLEHYVVMLQLRIEGQWQTIQLLDNVHGPHDLHRYTGNQKQAAELFMDGPARVVMPRAIAYLISNWEQIVSSWED